MNLSATNVFSAALVAALAVSCADAQPRPNLVATVSGRWTNSLGMIFVPVPHTRISFSIYETRVKDFAAFAATNPRLDGTNWNHALYHGVTAVSTSPAYPVVNVSRNDA